MVLTGEAQAQGPGRGQGMSGTQARSPAHVPEAHWFARVPCWVLPPGVSCICGQRRPGTPHTSGQRLAWGGRRGVPTARRGCRRSKSPQGPRRYHGSRGPEGLASSLHPALESRRPRQGPPQPQAAHVGPQDTRVPEGAALGKAPAQSQWPDPTPAPGDPLGPALLGPKLTPGQRAASRFLRPSGGGR